MPPDARRHNLLELDLQDGQTITQIIQPFGLPDQLVHLVLVNGHYVAPEDRGTRCLQEGDALAIWPPIAGG